MSHHVVPLKMEPWASARAASALIFWTIMAPVLVPIPPPFFFLLSVHSLRIIKTVIKISEPKVKGIWTAMESLYLGTTPWALLLTVLSHFYYSASPPWCRRKPLYLCPVSCWQLICEGTKLGDPAGWVVIVGLKIKSLGLGCGLPGTHEDWSPIPSTAKHKKKKPSGFL